MVDSLGAEAAGATCVYILALGANLPAADGTPARLTCDRAAAMLDGLCGLRLTARSRWWESAPIPPLSGAPAYVNGVVRLEGAAVEPACLLAALHAIEARFGRVRPFPNAPRTLDLDLIDAHGLLVATPALTLPHPRAHLRAFVLRPLAEVAPDWVHPRSGLGIDALLAGVADQQATPIDD